MGKQPWRQGDAPESEIVMPPVPMSMEERMMALLEKFAENRSSDDPAIRQIAEGMEKLAAATLQGSERIAEETRRTVRPSNEQVHMRSTLNPRGELLDDYTKPKLMCEMFLPWVADDASLTREEVELLNLLCTLGQGKYTITRVDDSLLELTVKINYALGGVIPNRLTIYHETAYNKDSFRNMPPLRTLLRQIISSANNGDVEAMAKKVMTMAEEVAAIKRGELSVSR